VQIGSEDCLHLNVTTPTTTTTGGGRLPVVVWIPGGGFVQGSGDQYDPTRLTTGGHVVTVTINYRLGALGLLDNPDVTGGDRHTGNFGLADRQAALRWVRRNIAAFGGDPRQRHALRPIRRRVQHLRTPGSPQLSTPVREGHRAERAVRQLLRHPRRRPGSGGTWRRCWAVRHEPTSPPACAVSQ
jgi:hypothetical protein